MVSIGSRTGEGTMMATAIQLIPLGPARRRIGPTSEVIAIDKRPTGAKTLRATPGKRSTVAHRISNRVQAGAAVIARKTAARRSALSGKARKARAAESQGEARKDDTSTMSPRKLMQRA